MNVSRRGCHLLATACAAMVALGACDDMPTTTVLDNAFPASPAPPVTVYKAWWITTLFPDAVLPGAASAAERTIPGADYAYALLAPGWSPDDHGLPSKLVAVRSATVLDVSAHDVLHLVVADTTFVGDCDAGSTLTVDDANLILRIFPGEFAGATYDPATCSTRAAAGAGGAGGVSEDGGRDGAGGIGGAGGGGG